MKVAISTVEYGGCLRRPFCPSRKIWPIIVDSSGLGFALGEFFCAHRLKLEVRFLWNYDYLGEWFVWPEDVSSSFGRSFENAKKQHRPPASDEGRDRDWDGISSV